MNNNTITKLQAGLGKSITYLILLFCVAVFVIYLVQRFGTSYAEEKIQEQLTQSGLAPFIHYDSVHLDPFTLTPSLEGVRFGNDNAPWLRFARISFNSYPFKYPNLDVDFWIEESSANQVSRDTAQLMQAAGIDILLGKGSLTSKVEGENVSSHFKLDIKDLGKLDVESKITLRDHSIVLSDLRSDILASFALGQPEALPIIYGEAIDVHDVDLTYTESGLIHHIFSQPFFSNGSNQDELKTLKQASQSLGLADANSEISQSIAETLLGFLKQPTTLTITLAPKSPTSLKDLALMASQDKLYEDSKMKITND